jgi:hypothetical protein
MICRSGTIPATIGGTCCWLRARRAPAMRVLHRCPQAVRKRRRLVSEWVLGERLIRAHRMLTDPRSRVAASRRWPSTLGLATYLTSTARSTSTLAPRRPKFVSKPNVAKHKWARTTSLAWIEGPRAVRVIRGWCRRWQRRERRTALRSTRAALHSGYGTYASPYQNPIWSRLL